MAQAKKDDGKRRDSSGRILKTGELQRKNGSYAFVYYDHGERHYAYAKSLSELRDKEKEIRRKLDNGIDISGQNITLNDYFDKCMERKTASIKPQTMMNYKSMYDANVRNSKLGKTKLSKIVPDNITDFYQHCRTRKESPLSYCSIKLLHNLINQTLKRATVNRYILFNPAECAMEDIENKTEEKESLTAEQLESMIKFCKASARFAYHVPFLTVAFETGLRVGEITGLTWSSVDLKRKVLYIEKQLQYKNFGSGCEFRVTVPKTKAGIREIELSDAAAHALYELKKIYLRYGIRCNVEIDGYNDFCFLTSNGTPYATNAVNSFLKNIVTAYNKAYPDSKLPHISAHIMRHTAATLLSESGMKDKALQGNLGHKNLRITNDTYNHSNRDTEYIREERRRIGNLINY